MYDKTLSSLERKGCEIQGSTIDISKPFNRDLIGNKTWGKIDFMYREGFRITGFADNKDYCPRFKK